MEYSKDSAVRFSERYAAARGFRRYGCRLSDVRPRALFSGSDYSPTPSERERDVFGAAQRFWLPNKMPVDARRLTRGSAPCDDFRSALLEASGYAYQYAARVNALRLLLVIALRAPVLPAVARNRAVAGVAGA